MAEIILVTAAVEIESDGFSGAVTVSPNTLTLVEGQGESSVSSAMNGGVAVPVHSEDITTKVGKIKFEMPASVNANNTARSVKGSPVGTIVVRVSGTDAAGNRYGRTLTQAAMVNDPEKAIQNDGKIPLEFEGAPLTVS